MSYCPKTLQPCIDDLCYMGGCQQAPGFAMMEKCDGCGAFTSADEPFGCTCEPDYDDEDRA